MILARLKHLPLDSATIIAEGGDGWTLENHLQAHLYGATAGEKHPWLPEHKKQVTPGMQAARKAALARKKKREIDIAEGRIT